MKRRDIIKQLESVGWTLKRHGASHDIYQHPNGEKIVQVPRHREVDEYTGKSILKEAGL